MGRYAKLNCYAEQISEVNVINLKECIAIQRNANFTHIGTLTDLKRVQLHWLSKQEIGNPISPICYGSLDNKCQKGKREQLGPHAVCSHFKCHRLRRSTHDSMPFGEFPARGWICNNSRATSALYGWSSTHLSEAHVILWSYGSLFLNFHLPRSALFLFIEIFVDVKH